MGTAHSCKAGNPSRQPRRKVGRNEPCLCGSGSKYKKCCGML
ncbi:SEC-C metal-binding domain-containing protein [Aquamicrobium sp. LC103]|nr:SEC-C metal-binding domain-containing protein [Aquamicrobium sp. LC103]